MDSKQIQYQAEILANRVKKRYAHLRKRFARQNIECFRLYDWDIPEVRAVVDWYAGHVVIGEYEREQTGDYWLGIMADAVAKALNISQDNIHLKRRRTKTDKGPRYSKMDAKGERFQVQERDLKFWVNLGDFLDTGLFSDHRETRLLVKELAAGKNFLNLYAYTGAFTCAAALGGAQSTVTVDRSATYLRWAQDNLELNSLWGEQHTIIRSDVDDFLEKASHSKKRFDLTFIDPPSFFTDLASGKSFDISKDHPKMLRNICKIMLSGSTIIFSTNHQRFKDHFKSLPVKDICELTPKTIPEDYRNQTIHRCWKMTVK